MIRSALALAVVVLAPAQVLALAGDLEQPGLASHPGDDTTAIMAVLNSERHEYAGGLFLNSFSTMHFRGDVEALNMFIGELSEIDNVTVHVRFSKSTGVGRTLRNETGVCQWRMTHHPSGTAHEIGVTVFLGDGRIDLDNLRLPAIRGAKVEPKPLNLPAEDAAANDDE
jgi:hypothetical protein